MGCKITDAVRKQVQDSFAPDEAELVISELEAADLPLIVNNGERVHLAILLLSKGDLGKFERELKGAKVDWRDTLVAAGLG